MKLFYDMVSARSDFLEHFQVKGLERDESVENYIDSYWRLGEGYWGCMLHVSGKRSNIGECLGNKVKKVYSQGDYTLVLVNSRYTDTEHFRLLDNKLRV